jgi:hypothetical protein
MIACHFWQTYRADTLGIRSFFKLLTLITTFFFHSPFIVILIQILHYAATMANG